jgi:Asp-tRNA(Asn)/Glu-tRNA(Gln) amidotransferase A subunit family amidase
MADDLWPRTPGRLPPPASAPPQDLRVDRRAFLHRMGALTAAATAGAAWPGRAGAQVNVPSRGTGAERVTGERGFWEEARQAAAESGAAQRAPSDLTAWEAGARIRDGSLASVELVEDCLERIWRLDGVLMAFNTVTDEAALAEAAGLDGERRRRGATLAPGDFLHGIPLAIKDNVYVAGFRTTANAHMFQDFVPSWDATLVTRLRSAGSVVLGKTQMGPLATTRALTPDGEITTLNAWAPGDPRISPGGSSSGSATAVAAGMATSSMGTQTGGSITVPALAQGLTGLKPTMGRVSLRGVIPLTYTRDHPGPLARDARDAALLLQAMAGPDPGDPRTLGLPPVPDYLTAALPVPGPGGPRMRWPTRLGVPPGWDEGNSARAARRRAFLQALQAGGVERVELSLPPGWAELSSPMFNDGRLPERSEPFLPWLREDVRLFGVTLSSWIQGLLLSGDEYVKAQRGRLALLRLALDQVFSRCDAVLQESHVAFDMIGLPLLAMPIGLRMPGEDGAVGVSDGGFDGPLPAGVLIGAAPFGEERLLALAALWQARSDHHRRRPMDPEPPVGRSPGGPGRPAPDGLRPGVSRGRLSLEAVAELSE